MRQDSQGVPAAWHSARVRDPSTSSPKKNLRHGKGLHVRLIHRADDGCGPLFQHALAPDLAPLLLQRRALAAGDVAPTSRDLIILKVEMSIIVLYFGVLLRYCWIGMDFLLGGFHETTKTHNG